MVGRAWAGCGPECGKVMATCNLQWNLNVVSGSIDLAMRFWPAAICLVLATCDLQWILLAASGITVLVGWLWNARSWVRLSFPSIFCFVAFAARSQQPVFYSGFWPAVIWQVTAHYKIQWILNFGAESPQYMRRLCRDTIWQVTVHWKTQMVLERRCRIASLYQVILTPVKSGRLIQIGKSCDSAPMCSNLLLQLRESGSIEKHNGLWPPSQNPLYFTGCRDAFAATCKIQRILTRRP